MNIFKINRLESRDSFSTYTLFRTILIQVHEARNKLQKFSSSISEKKSYSPFIVDKITIHRDKIKYYSTKKETRNVRTYRIIPREQTNSKAGPNRFDQTMKKNSHSTYPPFDLVHPIEGTFHERKENGDSRDVGKKGRFRRDFFLEKATRERGWRGKRRSAKGRGELDRRERIEIYSSSFCLEAVHTPLTCPFPDACSNPLLSPGEISSIVYGGGK